MNALWAKDAAERAVRAFLVAFLGQVVASGALSLPGITDTTLWSKAAVAGIAAAASVVLSAIGANVGDPTSASLLTRARGRHARQAQDLNVRYAQGGVLPPGRLAYNATGASEPVTHPLTPVPSNLKALGRRRAKNARALLFADHLAAAPTHPITDLAPSLVWSMDHNDTVGCCVIAGADHFRQVVYTSLGAAYTPWTDAELLKLYQTQNPHFTKWSQGGTSADGGMDIQTFLEYLVKQGIVLGFAKVDHTNVDEMRAAVYLGLGVITGEVLTSKNMNEQVWDYHARDTEEGGHCTVSVGYDPTEDQVSWGALYAMTDAFLAKNVEEAWFIVTQAHVDHPAFRAGFDLASFAAAYKAMTGATFPVPVTPDPVPTPGPVPVVADADDQRLWSDVKTWVAGGHGSTTKAVAAALKEWAADKQLT